MQSFSKYFTDLRGTKNYPVPFLFGVKGAKDKDGKLALGPDLPFLASVSVQTGWGPHLREREMALTVALRLRQVEDLVHVGLSQGPAESREKEPGH